MASDSHLDVFLILAGIPGESRDASYSGGIEILGFTLGSESLAPKSKKKRKKEEKKQADKAEKGTGDDDDEDSSGGDDSADRVYLKITKEMDSSSARLLQNYSRTKTSILKLKPLPVIKTGKIVVRKMSGVGPLPFMTLGFTDLLVVEYEMSYDDEESNVPTEEITLAFNSCTLHYAPQVEHGGLDHSHEAVGWDFKTNKPKTGGPNC